MSKAGFSRPSNWQGEPCWLGLLQLLRIPQRMGWAINGDRASPIIPEPNCLILRVLLGGIGLSAINASRDSKALRAFGRGVVAVVAVCAFRRILGEGRV